MHSKSTYLSGVNSILDFLPPAFVRFGQQTVGTFVTDWVILIGTPRVYCWRCVQGLIVDADARIRRWPRNQRIIISRAANMWRIPIYAPSIALRQFEKCYWLLTKRFGWQDVQEIIALVYRHTPSHLVAGRPAEIWRDTKNMRNSALSLFIGTYAEVWPSGMKSPWTTAANSISTTFFVFTSPSSSQMSLRNCLHSRQINFLRTPTLHNARHSFRKGSRRFPNVELWNYCLFNLERIESSEPPKTPKWVKDRKVFLWTQLETDVLSEKLVCAKNLVAL